MYHDLIKIIEENTGDAVEFGDSECDLSPSMERITETETLIGVSLPSSYIWFVKNYGGGEVFGEEIFSIYPTFGNESVGDIAYQTLWFREQNFVRNTDIVICSNDFGEVFLMDATLLNENNEYKIFIQLGKNKQEYARSFDDFLIKRISNPTG